MRSALSLSGRPQARLLARKQQSRCGQASYGERCAVAKAQARHFLDRVWLVGQPRGAAKRGKPSCGGSPIEQRLRYNDYADRESNRARAGGFGQGDWDARAGAGTGGAGRLRSDSVLSCECLVCDA